MHDLLKDPKKRKQLMIAGVAAGGVVLFLLLRKKSTTEATTETGASPAVEQVPVESGSGSGTGSGAGGANGEAIGPLIQGLEQSQATQTEQIEHAQAEQTAGFLSFLNGLSSGAGGPSSTAGGSTETPGASPAGGPGHTGTPLAAAVVNNQAGNPRKGLEYTVGKIDGKEAHIYKHAVPGGVGPGGKAVILGKSRTPSTPPQENKQAGNPRKGASFKTVKIGGHTVHEYTHAVPHGVGPNRNRIYV